ncbi:hypothetical protein HMPREF0973_01716 [Prevotella veroralis F0319]|uniref:Uncharacterized protein n=1 Tax=Prevotella veroralis F0319 TaxID=649761 RepID=C9MQ17_9BACT|nr:hypothetical protein HMPREF0973_01716 [Prevotella veroralis F0319]
MLFDYIIRLQKTPFISSYHLSHQIQCLNVGTDALVCPPHNPDVIRNAILLYRRLIIKSRTDGGVCPTFVNTLPIGECVSLILSNRLSQKQDRM